MKLYYSKGACSLSTHIIIHELGIPCEFESVDLAKKVTETGVDFYTINPKGAVPTLQTDEGELLTENLAIQQYLADNFDKQNKLCPAMGELQRYKVIAWLSFAASDLHKAFGPFFHYKEADEKMVKLFKATLERRLRQMEEQLAHHDYIADNVFTLPDAYIFVTLRWLRVASIDINDYPNLTAYFNRIKARPSVIKAMTEEGLTQ